MDETYVNGEKVGGMMQEGAWNQERVYSVPATLVVDTVLQLAVRVIDYQGGGGIWGNGKLLGIAPDSSETGIDLSGMWKYLPVAEYQSGVFHVFGSQGNQFKNCPKLPFDFSAYAPTALFNGMINPLVPFALRGAIWYQGEANTDAPALYKRTFPAMIADWRSAFRQGDFPFYFTQLAPWAYGPRTESQYLRESQLQTLRVRNTGMAVTLDIGNPKNIHPANKQDVGKRLALWALGRTYGKKVTVSGPIFKSMKIAKGKAILSFNYADGGLTLRAINGEHPFLVAGTDSVFRKGQVRVDGMTLVVSHPEIRRPIAVRYAWSNEDEGTLFNKAGLPAPSFRTDSW
jgi:sialate O-acetylesterase